MTLNTRIPVFWTSTKHLLIRSSYLKGGIMRLLSGTNLTIDTLNVGVPSKKGYVTVNYLKITDNYNLVRLLKSN